MASVIGHGLSSYWLYTVFRDKSGTDPFPGKAGLFVVIFLAILPDMDVLVNIIYSVAEGTNSVAHRGFSHSLLFAAMASLFVFAVNKIVGGRSSFILIAASVSFFLMHMLLDFLMGAGPTIKPFLPFSEKGYLSPIKIIPTAHYASSASGFVGVIFNMKTWAGIILEIGIFLPLVIASNHTLLNKVKVGTMMLYPLSLISIAASIILYEFGVGGRLLEFFKG
jgi:membrane-bound metal-dependent hydrolase YbcI (DUF457 family)